MSWGAYPFGENGFTIPSHYSYEITLEYPEIERDELFDRNYENLPWKTSVTFIKLESNLTQFFYYWRHSSSISKYTARVVMRFSIECRN